MTNNQSFGFNWNEKVEREINNLDNYVLFGSGKKNIVFDGKDLFVVKNIKDEFSDLVYFQEQLIGMGYGFNGMMDVLNSKFIKKQKEENFRSFCLHEDSLLVVDFDMWARPKPPRDLSKVIDFFTGETKYECNGQIRSMTSVPNSYLLKNGFDICSDEGNSLVLGLWNCIRALTPNGEVEIQSGLFRKFGEKYYDLAWCNELEFANDKLYYVYYCIGDDLDLDEYNYYVQEALTDKEIGLGQEIYRSDKGELVYFSNFLSDYPPWDRNDCRPHCKVHTLDKVLIDFTDFRLKDFSLSCLCYIPEFLIYDMDLRKVGRIKKEKIKNDK